MDALTRHHPPAIKASSIGPEQLALLSYVLPILLSQAHKVYIPGPWLSCLWCSFAYLYRIGGAVYVLWWCEYWEDGDRMFVTYDVVVKGGKVGVLHSSREQQRNVASRHGIEAWKGWPPP